MDDNKKSKDLLNFLKNNRVYFDILSVIILIVIAFLLSFSVEFILLYFLGFGIVMAGVLYLLFMFALRHRNRMEKARYYSKSVRAARFMVNHIEAISSLFFILAVILTVPFEQDSGVLLLFAYFAIVRPLLDYMKNSDKRKNVFQVVNGSETA